MKTRGFTLLETLLSLMVFSIAVVALVEAVNQLGNSTLHRRREAMVQEHMRSLLIEHTRISDMPAEAKVQENGVTYTVRRVPLELRSQAGLLLPDLFEFSVTATWHEGSVLQQAMTETWAYPPLFRPPGT